MSTINYYNKVEEFVVKSFNKVNKEDIVKHSIRTSYWLKKLNPNVDDSIILAGLAHDIERAYQDEKTKGRISGPKDTEYLRLHQDIGGKIIFDYLINIGASEDFAQKVKFYVSTHEDGGNDEQNLLMDADTLSFFENIADRFVNVTAKTKGKEVVKAKFDYMYNRLHSDKAKRLCKPMYEKALKGLEKAKNND